MPFDVRFFGLYLKLIMKTPLKRALGGARRVPKQEQIGDEDEIIDQEATPTMKSVNKYEFNAPQFHDFEKQEQVQNDSIWFGSDVDNFRAATRQSFCWKPN
jgi:hypothetical protein